ncbi:Gldg family protein [Pseudomonas sp. PDM05]|jgi:ABC-type uncharacterized transport system involved in gliding motility auxiliary subunit|uniref:Gldg family protein n=1 Tax=Pseudomonas sp. PDM05 TaxID=2769301 RepID=UPI001781605F|nr:Gldg family protein [Pseudomonas sp. PDM05]MBD9458544.1 Gldg family protein [Pseudomonas sp. PDM05]
MGSALRASMTLIVIALLFLAFNLVWAVKLPDLRWDPSALKTNTLSPAVLHLLAAQESPVDLYYFNARHHPKKSAASKRYAVYVEKMLKAFETAANGMINLHIIDPGDLSDDAYRAGLYGLDDSEGFFGLIGTRNGQAARRIESFNPDRAALLEYEISHLISQLSQPQPATIGLLSGQPIKTPAAALLRELHRHVNLVDLPAELDRIPSHFKTLMLVHPRRLPEQTLYAIDQFVLGGGKLMMFIDPLSALDTDAPPASAKLDGLLASWGVRMPADLVLIDSRYAAHEPPGSDPTRLTLPRQAMTRNDVSSWRLDSVTLASSGALFALHKSRTRFTPLLQSSEQSALLDANNLAVNRRPGEPLPHRERHVIAARLEGPAYSSFPDGVGEQPPGLQKAAQIHVVVVADTDMLTLSPTRSAQLSNHLFVLNTLDNLAAPEALANIRPRAMANYGLHVVENLQNTAARAYQDQADELERRLAQAEQEWQRLNPPITTLGTEAVDTSTQLQALNKERLRLAMELQTLKVDAYKPLQRWILGVKLLVIVPLPLLLCLSAWALFRWQHRRRPLPLQV